MRVGTRAQHASRKIAQKLPAAHDLATVHEHMRNADAVKFWRRVVSAYTAGRYQERMVNGEVHQRFESGSRRAR